MNKADLLKMSEVEIVELLKGNETVSTSNGYDEKLRVNRTAIEFILSDEDLTEKYIHLINKSCFEDPQIMLNAGKNRLSAIELISNNLKSDKYFFKMLTHKNVFALRFASDELLKDKELIDFVTSKRNSEMEFASVELRKDEEFIYSLAKKCPIKLDYLDSSLKENVNFILKMLKISPNILNTRSINKETVLKIVEKKPIYYRFLNDFYKDDYDVFNLAFEKLPLIFCHSPEKFQDDINILRRLKSKKELFENTTVLKTWFSESMDKLNSLEEKEWMKEEIGRGSPIKVKITKF